MTRESIDLPKTVEECHELIIQLVLEKALLENNLFKTKHSLDVLKEQMRDFARNRFGRSSEKLTSAQLSLFTQELLVQFRKELAGESSSQNDQAQQNNESSKKHGGGRKALPVTLDRVYKEYKLSGDELQCPCGCQMTEIGIEITEQLEYVPATLKVIEHKQHKYACKGCQEGVKIAPKPAQPFGGGQASAGLVAHIIEDIIFRCIDRSKCSSGLGTKSQGQACHDG